MADEVNSRRELFSAKMEIDTDALAKYEPPVAAAGGAEGAGKEPQPKPFGANT